VVIILAPDTGPELNPASKGLAAEVPLLEMRSKVLVLSPDEAASDAIGPNPLDPERRAPAAHAGQAQGRRLTSTLRDIWPSQ
jgi:NTE family protein